MVLSALLMWLNSQAQDPREAFEAAKRNQTSSFDQFKAKNDSTFARFVRESWKQMKLDAPIESMPEPKPDAVKEFDDDLQEMLWEDWPQDSSIIMRSFTPEPLESPDYFPEIKEASFEFFGAGIKVKYPIDLLKLEVKGTGKDALFDYWLDAGQTGFQVTLRDLDQIQREYSLPDFGLFLLLEKFVSHSKLQHSQGVLIQWFLLNKLGIACKVGYANQNPVLLLGTNGKIYGKPYFRQGGALYYALGEVKGNLFTYGDPGKNELRLIDLTVLNPIDLPLAPKNRQLSFEHNAKKFEFNLWYNENVNAFLDEFPDGDLRFSISSSASRLTLKSLKKELDPILENLTEVQKVAFLLAMTQSFDYQTDTRQFGKEKIFYPDQFVAFEYSDCDDRVVFLAYLLRVFTDLDFIAILFPQHVALAVHLAPPAYGESVMFNGRKYTFCDPTYFNAPLGAVIPEADMDKARILMVPN